jgi:autotransporter-associated beta strand protein
MSMPLATGAQRGAGRRALTAARTVTVDANRNIGGITFGNTSTFGFTLSSGNLLLTNGGVIQNLLGTGNHTDTISSAITIQGNGGSATFTANATSGTSLLSIANVSGVSTAGNTTTVNLNGSNTATGNEVRVLTNGTSGGKLALVKSGAGTWSLGLPNTLNTFTGGITINAGTLRAGTGAGGAGARLSQCDHPRQHGRDDSRPQCREHEPDHRFPRWRRHDGG